MSNFFSRLKAKRSLKERGLTPLEDADREQIKSDINDLINVSGTYFASLGIAIESHYEALDEETREELIEDSVFYINRLNKMLQKAGNDHYGVSLLYALLYYAYCSNTTLCTEEMWGDYFNGIRTTFDLRMNDKDNKNSMSGYA